MVIGLEAVVNRASPRQGRQWEWQWKPQGGGGVTGGGGGYGSSGVNSGGTGGGTYGSVTLSQLYMDLEARGQLL